MNKKRQIILLLALGLFTRFFFFGHPAETVFDEVHFGKFVSGYYTREYFFDIHPPLGKLMIAGFAKLSGFKPEFAFAEIGDEYPNKQYITLRALPNLAGGLLPLVIYLLIVEMGLSRQAAFFGGLFIVFENAILTQSHYILMDSFLLLFGFLSLFFYFKYKNSILHTTYYILLSGLFAGLASSVKWTGLGFLALPLLFEFIKIIREKQFKSLFGTLLPPLVIAASVYFIFFWIHLAILSKSGPGNAFMSPGFQKTLSSSHFQNQSDIKPSKLFQKFTELNVEMYKANQRITAKHPYSSQWYTWPLMTRPIYYWVKDSSRIYLIGNPIIWWASIVAILYSVLSIIYFGLKTKKLYYILHTTYYFLLVGYILNLLPFIGVKRVMFLYHYFTAYIFAVIMLVWLISQSKNSEKIFRVLLIVSIAAFLFFAPLTYGLPLSNKAYEARVWFASWR